MDFKTKLAVALVAASLLSMGSLGYFTHLWAQESFVKDSQRQLSAFAEDRKGNVESIVAQLRGQVASLVEQVQPATSVSSYFDFELSRDPFQDTDAILEDLEAEHAHLKRLILIEDEDSPARLLTVVDETMGPASADRDVEFMGARVDPTYGLLLVFQTTISRDNIRLGVLEAAFDIGVFNDLLGASNDIGMTGETYLLVAAMTGAPTESQWKGAYAIGSELPDTELIYNSSASPSISAAIMGRTDSLIDALDYRDRMTLATIRPIDDFRSGIVVQVESAEVRGRADQLLNNMRILGVSLAIFAILGGTLFGFYLAAPINKLVNDVDRIRHGELGLRLEVRGEDEAAFLAQSLNEFMDQLDRSTDLFQLGETDVLVICDDQKERALLRDLLKSWNMRPALADNGPSAIAAFEQAAEEGRSPRLILLDESIADSEFDQLVAEMRLPNSTQIPIILLSSSIESLDSVALSSRGIGHAVPKPVVSSELLEAILSEIGIATTGVAPTADVLLKRATPRKILVCEDNALIQRVMVEFLENWGHGVTVANNGHEALQRVQREKFDLIFMNVKMPRMNGLETTAAIRASQDLDVSRTPIVALTAESSIDDRDRCLAAGMDDYISKPADPRTLYAIIERYPAKILHEKA